MSRCPVLSVLELALRERERTVQEALAAVVETAVGAERLGYKRFWLSEHHEIPAMSTPSPAVVAARVAAATTTIRVGAGGVMLPNHSPRSTAEAFASLNAMFPQRIDLGLGRGPGTHDKQVLEDLRGPNPRDSSHEDDVREVLQLLDKDARDGRNALPDGTGSAACWILASSPDGAQLAGELGLPLAVAHFLNPQGTKAAVAAYRDHFRPSSHLSAPWLAVSVMAVAAGNEKELQLRARPGVELVESLRSGAPEPLPPAGRSISPDVDARTVLNGRGWVGTAEEAREGLRDLATQTSADELQLVVPVFNASERVHVLELCAAAVRE